MFISYSNRIRRVFAFTKKNTNFYFMTNEPTLEWLITTQLPWQMEEDLHGMNSENHRCTSECQRDFIHKIGYQWCSQDSVFQLEPCLSNSFITDFGCSNETIQSLSISPYIQLELMQTTSSAADAGDCEASQNVGRHSCTQICLIMQNCWPVLFRPVVQCRWFLLSYKIYLRFLVTS